MKYLSYFLLIAIYFLACSPKNKSVFRYESEELKIKALSARTFVHISYLQTKEYGKVGCNGMLYFNGKEAIIFDTPTNDTASLELLEWVKKQKKEVKAVVITHFHNDCLGGLKAFHEKGIESWANRKTIAILQDQEENMLPIKGFEKDTTIGVGKENVKLSFFGEGHTKDNIVGHIESEKVLFGGCLIKSLHAGKGYLGDANTAEWSNTVARLKKQYPDLKVVVPGHGKDGGPELLDFTIQLFSEYRP